MKQQSAFLQSEQEILLLKSVRGMHIRNKEQIILRKTIRVLNENNSSPYQNQQNKSETLNELEMDLP